WSPLRERAADIVPLAERLLAKHGQKLRQAPVRLSDAARCCLQEYSWPGNVRELDNAIQRALILHQGGLIEPADLCLDGSVGLVASVSAAAPMKVRPGVEEPPGGLGDDLRRREFQLIIDTLRAERGRRKE